MQLGEVGVFAVEGTAQRVQRTPLGARRAGLDQFKVCVLLTGSAVVAQDGRAVPLAPGQLALYDLAKPYSLTFGQSWRVAVMTLPRRALDLPAGTLAAVMRRAHPCARGAGRLLAHYLSDCLDPASELEGNPRLGEAGISLLSGAMASCGDCAVDTGTEAARAAVLAYVRHHLGDPDLSPQVVAGAHHMLLRSLQRLFQGEGRTVAGIIRDLRLAAVRADLEDPLLSTRTIAGVAARHGVTDQAWLSRAFRETFGSSPSQHRREALES